MAKNLPFIDYIRQKFRPLALLHFDVWISPVTSVGGCRFYVLFVDDFSRFTWTYPIRYKYDEFVIFRKYKALVENPFSCQIQQLLIDNDGEYLSNKFKEFLSNNGIRHHLICLYTSQQNGIAKRKH